MFVNCVVNKIFLITQVGIAQPIVNIRSDINSDKNNNEAAIPPVNKTTRGKSPPSGTHSCPHIQLSDNESSANNKVQTGEEIKDTVEAKDISFSVMFSDDDDDALSGEGMDLQLSRQISRVESFLKMDRLRRTKLNKL